MLNEAIINPSAPQSAAPWSGGGTSDVYAGNSWKKAAGLASGLAGNGGLGVLVQHELFGCIVKQVRVVEGERAYGDRLLSLLIFVELQGKTPACHLLMLTAKAGHFRNAWANCSMAEVSEFLRWLRNQRLCAADMWVRMDLIQPSISIVSDPIKAAYLNFRVQFMYARAAFALLARAQRCLDWVLASPLQIQAQVAVLTAMRDKAQALKVKHLQKEQDAYAIWQQIKEQTGG